MAFTDQQVRKLRSRLKPQHVRLREIDGQTLRYLEGWHVVAEANRIFGFDGWDRETVSSTCVWTKKIGAHYCAVYVAKARITVRAGDAVIVREGSGAGESSEASPGQAHDRAFKAAETDATKRALTTFGNCFGLTLYATAPEPERRGLRALTGSAKPPEEAAAAVAVPAAQPTGNGHQRVIDPGLSTPDRPLGTAARGLAQNINGQAHEPPEGAASESTSAASDSLPALEAERLEGRTKEVAVLSESGTLVVGEAHKPVVTPTQPKIDKSVLAIAEPRRVRDPDHLKFVADQPCIICDRQPCEAHHLRYVQPRALGCKSSDAYTVPLCALHHRELHAKGSERAWWVAKGRDPLLIADHLWRQTSKQRTGRDRAFD